MNIRRGESIFNDVNDFLLLKTHSFLFFYLVIRLLFYGGSQTGSPFSLFWSMGNGASNLTQSPSRSICIRAFFGLFVPTSF